MTTTVTSRPIRLTFALVVTPVMRWAIAVHSVPDGQAWRSACTCGQSLWNGRFIATGRCTGYGQQIGAPPYTVEAADLRAAGAVRSDRLGDGRVRLAAATMLALASVDLAAPHHRRHNRRIPRSAHC
jgi:leader peptidase (prepilin peptidase)/N-methyltransferase